MKANPLNSSRGYLDLAKAKEIRDLTDESTTKLLILDLSSFDKVAPSSIQYLSQYSYDFVILGLTKINPKLSSALGNWTGKPYLIFERLTTLSKKSARALCQSSTNLDLGSLRSLAIDNLKELVKVEGHLHLSMDCLSIEMAAILKRHPSSLSFNLSQELSLKSAFEMANYQGWQLIICRLPKPPSKALMAVLRSKLSKVVTTDRQPTTGDFYCIESIVI